MSPPTPVRLASPAGRRLLAVLCAVAFLDFVDASITNVALPPIKADLGFSEAGLQWVPSAYLLSYGGFMLLGGRLADILGRRRVLLTGVLVLGLSSLIGGLAQSPEIFVAARLAQGAGAALTLPAALSVLTTTFVESRERHAAFGVWGGVAGLSSAVGILLGGVLTEGLGWRWVMFVNPIACAFIIPAVLAVVPATHRPQSRTRLDLPGGLLLTSAMLVLVFAIVKSHDLGWASFATWGLIVAGLVLLAVFVFHESRVAQPLFPPAVLKTPGIVAANLTGLVAFGGMLSMFYFLTLYMQTVLGYSPVQTGLAYLPLSAGVVISSGLGARAATRWGTRPVIVVGVLIAATGLFLLGQISVGGTYLPDVLPGTLLVAFGTGPVFVGVTAAANAGVRPEQAGLAAGILSSAQNVGGALGLAVLAAFATGATSSAIATGEPLASALTEGYARALTVGAVLAVAAGVVAFWTTNTRPGPPAAHGSAETPVSTEIHSR